MWSVNQELTKFNIDDLRNPEEAKTYKYLKGLERKFKYKVEYETEILPYVVKRTYVPDFILSFADGRKMYIEFKGYLRRDDEKKLIAIKEQHPELDVRICFMKDNKMAGRKMRYSKWAEKHGIPYCFGVVPEDWLYGE